ncbi:hypothetical protein [Streptomyces sp. NPDC002232]|uniref:hypothetical protein n=1 Tax=Streptomyces sp. NPDC002232 TaxID=3364640 RepID=UPI0036A2FB2E
MIGSDLAGVGQKWNIALPLMYNTSPGEIQVTAAEVDHVPDGIRILGYGAYDRNDTEGVALISRVGSPGMPDFDALENHATRAIPVEPGTESDVYYVVRVEITGNVTDNITGATFTYRSGQHTSTQSLPFEASLRLERPKPVVR